MRHEFVLPAEESTYAHEDFRLRAAGGGAVLVGFSAVLVLLGTFVKWHQGGWLNAAPVAIIGTLVVGTFWAVSIQARTWRLRLEEDRIVVSSAFELSEIRYDDINRIRLSIVRGKAGTFELIEVRTDQGTRRFSSTIERFDRLRDVLTSRCGAPVLDARTEEDRKWR